MFAYIYLCAPYMCLVPKDPLELQLQIVVGSHSVGARNIMIPGSLPEQQVLLTAEQSLQPHAQHFYIGSGDGIQVLMLTDWIIPWFSFIFLFIIHTYIHIYIHTYLFKARSHL